MAAWDPVMFTIYLNDLYAEAPKQTPVSETRRRSVVDTIVVDLRQRSNQEDDGGSGRESEDRRSQPVDIYSVQD